MKKIGALEKEFAGASDRAAAIVAGAFLDEVLQELLRTFLVKDAKGDKTLFEGTGALASFSAKIEMSFRAGLVSNREHSALHTIRKIRNDFAHELNDTSFLSQSIFTRCKNIEVPIALVAPKHIPLPEKGRENVPIPEISKAPSDDARLIFQEAVITLMHCLAARVAQAVQSRRHVPADFSEAYEPAEVLLSRLKWLVEQTLPKQEIEMESGDVAGDNKRYVLLVKVQEFCVRQIRQAHAALRKQSNYSVRDFRSSGPRSRPLT